MECYNLGNSFLQQKEMKLNNMYIDVLYNIGFRKWVYDNWASIGTKTGMRRKVNSEPHSRSEPRLEVGISDLSN